MIFKYIVGLQYVGPTFSFRATLTALLLFSLDLERFIELHVSNSSMSSLDGHQILQC